MSIHIIFEDGSNPYLSYNLSVSEFIAELEKWQKLFYLEFHKFIGNSIIEFIATEKRGSSC